MQIEKRRTIRQTSIELRSDTLQRNVIIDLYLPPPATSPEDFPQPTNDSAFTGPTPLPSGTSLLIINDGQDLPKMKLAEILEDLYRQNILDRVVCAGIHAGPDRIREYGTADTPDFQGRGDRAAAYTQFVLRQVLPAIQDLCKTPFNDISYLGWSLGALSAMDIVWHHPDIFTRAGLFSGSFWWRSRDKFDPLYDETTDRIMQHLVRQGAYHPGLQFFFECGTEDETEDRNGNGIIDSIDDTRDLIAALVSKGYHPGKDISYIEIPGGRHDVDTWAKVLPDFLLWMSNKKPRR